jgi:ABC-type transport system involved in cytochrome c biogenesis ATPase subunit
MTAPIITRTCIRTHGIAIERLKGVRQLDDVSLEDKPLTGIFGPNGVGKSTILHALAAAYRAPEHAIGHHYWNFFPKLDHDFWNGTKFSVTHSGNMSNGGEFANAREPYWKGTATSRWHPLENRRPIREIAYIGLKSCLPALERYSMHDLSGARLTPLADRRDVRALATAGQILNCPYSEAATVSVPGYPSRSYLAFTRPDFAVPYPSLTMGAGEQRLFAFLQIVERTRNHSMILVDEIDVLLHGDALQKLVAYLHGHCVDKGKQIVFTSHREELLHLGQFINIRHIHSDARKHRCFPSTDPDSLRRLTGNQTRTIEVFVEDDLAKAIVSHIATELGISRHLRIILFGSSQNCFPVLSGLLIKGETCNNCLFVLDGDVHLAAAERQGLIDAACTGDDERAVALRALMPSKIRDFVLPANVTPEPFLHGLIVAQNPDGMSEAEKEIRQVAVEIVNPPDRHHFVDKVVETLGDNRDVHLTRLIPLAAKHDSWAAYTAPVREWLLNKKTELHLV